MTRNEAEEPSHASTALCLDLRLILLQPAGKPDATKAPSPHQFSQAQLQGNKSFWRFTKKRKVKMSKLKEVRCADLGKAARPRGA